MAVEVGQVLDGKYRIIRLIGKGGMGAVYEATHLLIDRRVAVKELHADAAAAEHAITRFEREARAAGRIGSDHIMQVFDLGVLPDGSRYMVSEFLDGETLDSRIRRVGRLTAAELLPIAQQLLTGLADAHEALVLHRDLKPDNVFLVRPKTGAADLVKIIDFGIAKFEAGINPQDALKMTKTGMVVGTPYYLSPEQARGTGDADARSDLYAVGVILYECITGDVPFNAQNFNDLIFKIVLEKPQPPAERAPGIDQRLSDLILKAMARDPAARFQTAQEMMAALTAWATSDDGSNTVNLGLNPSTPHSGQTRLSSQDPLSLSPSGAAVRSDVSLRTLASPTPASFGATRDPRLSTPELPPRSKASMVLFLSLGGAVLLLLVVVGFVALGHGQSKDPAAAESVALPVASGTLNGPPTIAPALTAPPAEVASPVPSIDLGLPLPLALPANGSEVPRAQSATLRPAPRTQPAKRAAAAPAPAPAPTTRAAPAEPPRPAPAKRGDWGY